MKKIAIISYTFLSFLPLYSLLTLLPKFPPGFLRTLLPLWICLLFPDFLYFFFSHFLSFFLAPCLSLSFRRAYLPSLQIVHSIAPFKPSFISSASLFFSIPSLFPFSFCHFHHSPILCSVFPSNYASLADTLSMSDENGWFFTS